MHNSRHGDFENAVESTVTYMMTLFQKQPKIRFRYKKKTCITTQDSLKKSKK